VALAYHWPPAAALNMPFDRLIWWAEGAADLMAQGKGE
jgi:hypothetical protein